MSITEEQRIGFIISKIDIHLEEYKDKPIKEAINLVFSNYLTEEERNNFSEYFYKLYKGYMKYRHLNLLIDYYKAVERLKAHNRTNNSNGESDEDIDVFSPPDDEISEIEAINQKELIKLKSFGLKFFMSAILIGIVGYTIVLIALNIGNIEVITNLFSNVGS